MASSNIRVGDVETEIAQALDRLSVTALPPGLEGLKHLIPPRGMAPRVGLYKASKGNSADRKIRSNADALKYWNVNSCKAVIHYEPSDETADRTLNVQSPVEKSDSGSAIEDVIKALAAAEREPRFREFVGIKQFRDQYLTVHAGSWAADSQRRKETLSDLIRQGLVLRSSVPNPKEPAHPTTAIRINREHPDVRTILQISAIDRSPFKPIAIRGEALSATVLSERR